jgi:hypothetical protein
MRALFRTLRRSVHDCSIAAFLNPDNCRFSRGARDGGGLQPKRCASTTPISMGTGYALPHVFEKREDRRRGLT